jgi:hypothetical protein
MADSGYGTAPPHSGRRQNRRVNPALSPAELSSLSSSLEEIGRRVRQMAERAAPADADDEAHSAASDLWEVERLLTTAQRRLTELSR